MNTSRPLFTAWLISPFLKTDELQSRGNITRDLSLCRVILRAVVINDADFTVCKISLDLSYFFKTTLANVHHLNTTDV